jgi:hypothetical protein
MSAKDVFHEVVIFKLDFPKAMIEENQVKMIIYDVEQEVIFKWIN